MSVCCAVVQFSAAWMMLVACASAFSSRHDLKTPYLRRFVVRFCGKLVGAVGKLPRSFVMPVAGGVVALFVVLGSCAVGLGRKCVLLRSFPMQTMYSGILIHLRLCLCHLMKHELDQTLVQANSLGIQPAGRCFSGYAERLHVGTAVCLQSIDHMRS
jgi:hypothetical protein